MPQSTLNKASQGKLLIIDDDPGIRDVLSYTASLILHFQVLQAEDGTSALQIIETEKVDVIVCDLAMPGMNGLSFFEKLRANGVKIPVLFLTGHGTEDMRNKAMKLGAFDFLQKPISVDQLTALLEEARRVSAQIQEYDHQQKS